jgi:HK97 family phage major capsid protein
MTYAPNQRSDQDAAFLAPEIATLLDATVKAKAVTAASSLIHSTARPSVDFPIFTQEVTTGFIAELADLPLSNADTASVNVPAYKVAGATQVSSETLSDMDPEIATLIGTSLADQTVHSLDAAFLSVASTTNGFAGLLGKSYLTQDTNAATASIDDIIHAVFAINGAGGLGAPKADTLILSVPSALALSLTKTATGYNTYALPIVQADGGSVLEGLKVIVSDLVDSATAGWVLDSTKQRLVLRQGTAITRTYVPQNDSWFISSVSRYGWDTLNQHSIVRLYNAA